MILILEDNIERMVEFRKRMIEIGSQFHWTNNAKECIRLIETNKYDLILLDHDLGGEIFVDINKENTGSTVARWMSNYPNNLNKDTPVIIHSHNYPAAQYMMSRIKKAIYVPSIWLKDTFHQVVRVK